MTNQRRIAVFTAALIYAGITISIIATPSAMADMSTVAFGFANNHM
jgi:hypothetical protein